MSKASQEQSTAPHQQYAGDYIEYIREAKGRSSNTVAAYRQDLKCYAAFISNVDPNLAEPNCECITAYLKHLRHDRQLKPATVRRRILTVQSFCQWLVQHGILVTSPFETLALDLKVPKRLPRPVDPLTIRQLLAKQCAIDIGQSGVSQKIKPRVTLSQKDTTKLIVKLMLTTGIRVSEVCAIRIQDISSDGKTIHILGKGNKERLVYVENSQLANNLANYRIDRSTKKSDLDALLVNSRGRALTPQVVRKRLKTMCKELGTTDTPTPHRFRHSAATQLIEHGVDIRVVQRLLGHASISTTELYTQVTDVSLREALRRADILKQFQ